MPIRSAGVIHKGNPGPCVNRNRGRHGAVSAPVHGYLLGLSTVRPRIRCKLIRGQPHLRPTIAPQQQGEEYQQHQDDIASHAAPPLIVCAVPSADREGGSRALSLYTGFPLPTTLCRAVRAYPELSAYGRPAPEPRELFLRGYGEIRRSQARPKLILPKAMYTYRRTRIGPGMKQMGSVEIRARYHRPHRRGKH